jgi:hypothetical protein
VAQTEVIFTASGSLDEGPRTGQAVVGDEGMQVHAIEMGPGHPQAIGPESDEMDGDLGIHPIPGPQIGQLAQRAVVAHHLLSLPEPPQNVEPVDQLPVGDGLETHHLIANGHPTSKPQLEATVGEVVQRAAHAGEQ